VKQTPAFLSAIHYTNITKLSKSFLFLLGLALLYCITKINEWLHQIWYVCWRQSRQILSNDKESS